MRKPVLAVIALAVLTAAYVVLSRALDGPEDIVPWGLRSVSADGRRLTITWPRSDRHCFELDHVERTESSARVILRVVREGCRGDGIDVYTEDSTTVELDRPLGARALTDGCSGTRPPPASRLSGRFAQLVRGAGGGPFRGDEKPLCPTARARGQS